MSEINAQILQRLRQKSRTEWENEIYQNVYSERDRKVMARRLLDGIAFEPLAEEFELSTQQVKKIVTKWTKAIFK